jgi:hypothetical protein
MMAMELKQQVAQIDIEEKYDYRQLIWPKYKKGE